MNLSNPRVAVRQVTAIRWPLAALLVLGWNVAVAQTYDLTLGGSVKIGDAYFFPGATDAVAGSGTFGPFVRLQDNGVQDGYNSAGSPVMPDVKNGINFQFANFKVPANPGGMVDGVAYYSFSLDMNEGVSTGARYISLDRLQFFVRTADFTTGADAPNSFAYLNSTATKVYDLDAGTDKTLLLDGALVGGGSSTVDVVMLIPQSFFAPYSETHKNVFMYFEMGALGTSGGKDYTSDTGFEEWNAVSGLAFTIPLAVPEASTVAAGGGLALIVAGHFVARYRRRRQA